MRGYENCLATLIETEEINDMLQLENMRLAKENKRLKKENEELEREIKRYRKHIETL